MTSRRPYFPTTCSYSASTWGSSTRSACTACSPMECRTSSTPTTVAPSRANRSATAWPIGLAAPLITQTRPTSRANGSSRSLETGSVSSSWAMHDNDGWHILCERCGWRARHDTRKDADGDTRRHDREVHGDSEPTARRRDPQDENDLHQ